MKGGKWREWEEASILVYTKIIDARSLTAVHFYFMCATR